MNTFSYRFGPDALSVITTPSNSVYNFKKGDFAIEAWVKTLTGGPVLGRKVTEGGTDHGGFFLILGLTKVTFTCDDGSYWNSMEGPANVCDGRWHHVAVVRSGSTGYLYVDGEDIAVSFSGNASAPLNVDSIDRLTIGAVDSESVPNRFFRGLVTEIRLWNKARTAAKVKFDMFYRLESANVSPNLVGYWTGEFGFVADVSIYGIPTSYEGNLSGSGEIPPLLSFRVETFSTTFHGIYDNIWKYKSSSENPAAKQLAVTLGGFVILDESKTVKAPKIHGSRLKWSVADGNAFDADLLFVTYSAWDDDQQFQGYFIHGNTRMQVVGNLAPTKVGCGMLLNVSTGLILSCPGTPRIDSQVVLAKKNPHGHDHFCRYDSDSSSAIIHMHSGLSLKPESPFAGSKILCAFSTSGESWTMQGANLNLKYYPSLALSVHEHDYYPILADADPNDEKQQWLSLQDSQVIFNGTGGVLAAVSGYRVNVLSLSFTNGSSEHLWYFFRDSIINQETAQALTTTGQINSVLSLARWSPTNTNQQFTFNGRQLVHKTTGLIVSVPSLGAQLTLQAADNATDTRTEAEAGALWSINVPVKSPSLALDRHVRNVSTMTNDTTYIVTVYTGDFVAAGTNDKVEIILQSNTHSLPPIELKKTDTDSGMDPFERAQTDIFTLRNLPDIGTIETITVRYGYNNWLWNDRWVVNEITVRNKTRNVLSIFVPKGPTAQFEMPSIATFRAWNHRYVGIISNSYTMSLGMAPGQDALSRQFGWYHTWVSVVNNEGQKVKTWFDCAGGHEGPGTVNDVITGTCDLQSVVHMSTGYPYSEERPLREAYGTNRTDGVDNANVRAEGRLNWQGQCHQIANRYLWTCIPSITLNSVPNDQRPRGYGLTVFAFGVFGIGFTEWVRQIGFEKIGENNESSIYGLVKAILKTAKRSRDFLAWRLDLQYEIELESASAVGADPGGPAVRRFIDRMRSRGVTVNELARLTNYTEEQINELLKKKE